MTKDERQNLTRNKISRAASELFFLRGFTDVTISEIAEKADVSRVTLFKYFSSKEALADECVHKLLEEGLKYSDEIINDPTTTFKEKFDLMINIKKKKRNAMSDEFFKLIGSDSGKLRMILQKNIKEYSCNNFMRLMQMGKAEGEINPDISDEAIKDVFMLYYDFMTTSEFFTRDKSYIFSMIDIFSYGLLKR